MFTEQLTQFLSLPLASIFPVSNAAGTVYVGGGNSSLDMSRFRRIMGHLMVGIVSGTANAQAYFVASANSNMVSNTNVSATNQLIVLNASNSESTIECRADQLPAGNRYVALAIVINGSAVNIAGSLYAADAEYHPGQQYDNSNTTVLNTRLVL